MRKSKKPSISEIYDAPVEVVIAYGRLVLSIVSLIAVAVGGSEPSEYASLVLYVMELYSFYSIAILFALARGRQPIESTIIHLIDLSVTSALLLMTQGLFGPFAFFFNFILLAASLRWNWRGVALTAAFPFCLVLGSMATDWFRIGKFEYLTDSVVREAYLIVVGSLLAYASAHRERERQRLVQIAQWPASREVSGKEPIFESLRRAAQVLDADAAFAVWHDETKALKSLVWQTSGYEYLQECSQQLLLASFGEQAGLEKEVRTAESAANKLNFDPDRSIVVAPLNSLTVAGRLVAFIPRRAGHGDEVVATIVATQVSVEIDRQIHLEHAKERAAFEEREHLVRDLHDGLLQNLAAFRLNLEGVPAKDGGQVVKQVIELLRREQEKIRKIVDALRLRETDSIDLGALRPVIAEIASNWGCAVKLDLTAADRVSRRKFNEFYLLIAEAVANAVRHGNASELKVVVSPNDGEIHIQIDDNGRGFPIASTSSESVEIPAALKPKSLQDRALASGGTLRVRSSKRGASLDFEFPI
jgi:signal transduction histidine kinase